MTAIKSEIEGRLAEVTRIAGTTEFNGKKLLDGSMDNGINLQVGIMSGDDSVINLKGSLFQASDAESLLGTYSIQGNGDGKIGPSQNKSVKEATGNVVLFLGTDNETYAKIGNDYFHSTGTPEIDGVTYRGLETVSAEKAKELDERFHDENATNINRTNTGAKVIFGNKLAGAVDYTYKTMDNLDAVFTNDTTARAFLDNIDKALTNVTDRKTEIGAAQQRIASAMEVTNVMSTNFTSANSLIKDADIAEESSSYIKNQILQQTASSLLATANQNPSIAMSLI